jgi:hypothetical protein
MRFASRTWTLASWAAASLVAACNSHPPHADPTASPPTKTVAPPAVTTPTATAEPPALSNLPGCPEGVSCEEAERDLAEAKRIIARAGEHPTDMDLAEILPLLERAADSGYLPAQLRFGNYVVGYWYTDEMFWPKKQKVAIVALAMLRVAAKRSPGSDEPLLRVLAKDPVVFRESDGVPALPAPWVKAALAEAARWQKTHPGVVRAEL